MPAVKKMSADEEAEWLETHDVRSSAEELADADTDTPEVRRVKAVLRGETNPHAKEWGENFTHLNIHNQRGELVFQHPKNRAPGDDSKNGKGSIAPDAELEKDKDGFFNPVKE